MISVIIVTGIMLLLSRIDAAPARIERTMHSEMSVSDLESSATGYVYGQQQGLPVSYVRYTNHGSGRYYHAPAAVHYVVGAAAPVASAVPETTSSTVARQPALLLYTAKDVPTLQQSYKNEEIANYANEQLPKYVAAGSIKSEPRAPYYAPEKVETRDERAGEKQDDEENYGDDDEDDSEREDDEAGDQRDDEKDHDGSFEPEERSKDSSFESGSAKTFHGGEYSEDKEQGDKGYKNRKEFSKEEQTAHDDTDEEGYYDTKGNREKGHAEVEEEHGFFGQEEKDVKGNNHGHSSYHKKGHKTSGYHNVFHKDEYKKETDFYDDEHEGGHFKKYGEFKKDHQAEEGGFEKGGRHSSGSHRKDSGKKGYFDKGQHDIRDQNREAEEGEKSYYQNQADYSVEKESHSGKEYKFNH